MRLVLPNEDPDLDGAASAYAYGEFLKEEGEKATGAVFGDLDSETDDILEELDEEISDATYYLYSADEITLVSASSAENMSSRIPADKVTEVIDHEEIQMEDFENAELDIEDDLNTAAAIIARKFKNNDTPISKESATLLHAAITSAEETSEADTRLAEWLKQQKE